LKICDKPISFQNGCLAPIAQNRRVPWHLWHPYRRGACYQNVPLCSHLKIGWTIVWRIHFNSVSKYVLDFLRTCFEICHRELHILHRNYHFQIIFQIRSYKTWPIEGHQCYYFKIWNYPGPSSAPYSARHLTQGALPGQVKNWQWFKVL